MARHFCSAMLNDENLRLGRSSDGGALVDRVIAGLKPLAFVDSGDERLLGWVERARENGLLVDHFADWRGTRPWWLAAVAIPGRIGELFDLDALLGDYQCRYDGWTGAFDSVADEIERLRGRDMSDYLSFAAAEVDLGSIMEGTRHPAGEYARTGLLLGYPVATTIDVVRSSLDVIYASARQRA